MVHRKMVFERACTAIGSVCMEWASLELMLEEFAAILSLVKEKKIEEIVFGNSDIKSKILVVKGLVVARNLDKEWTAACIKYLDYLDNNLRPQRNNIVHSHWIIPNKKLTRTMRKTKLKRPQAYQLRLETVEETNMTPKQISKFADVLRNAWSEQFFLLCYAIDWDDPEIETPRELSYSRYLHLVGGARLLRRFLSKPKLPLQSSPR